MAAKQKSTTPTAHNGSRAAAGAFGEQPVLLVTEPGPSRTILGRLVNFLGRRTHAPFLVVACGVLAPDLLETDGVDNAAAAAATEPGVRRARLIEQARGGTLYLDGIEQLSAPQQARLLESLPPRTTDATEAAGAVQAPSIDPSDVTLLATIGEAPAAAVKAGRLSPELLERFTVVDLRPAADAAASDVSVSIGTTLADMEKAFILATLDHCDGDKRRSASMLGISLRTLYNRLHDWKVVEAWNQNRPSSDRAA